MVCHTLCQIWSRFRLQRLRQKRALLVPSAAVCVPLEPGSPGGGAGLRARSSSGRGCPGWVHPDVRSLLPGYHEEKAWPCPKRGVGGQRAGVRPAAPHAQHWYKWLREGSRTCQTTTEASCIIFSSYAFAILSFLPQHNVPPGADFTNTFRLLSRVPWPEEGDSEGATAGPAVDLILQQCASVEELKVANKPTMEDRWGSVWWLNTCVPSWSSYNKNIKSPAAPPYTPNNSAFNTSWAVLVLESFFVNSLLSSPLSVFSYSMLAFWGKIFPRQSVSQMCVLQH